MNKFLLTITLLTTALVWSSYAQQRSLSGTVVGTDGTPVQYASVFVEGTTSGTTTDSKGGFTLQLPANATEITVSCIGFQTSKVKIPPPQHSPENRP